MRQIHGDASLALTGETNRQIAIDTLVQNGTFVNRQKRTLFAPLAKFYIPTGRKQAASV